MSPDDNPYVHQYPSPAGTYVIKTADNEVRMSHWISSAVLCDGATGATLFDFGWDWSADVIHWIDDSRVELSIRHYPGDRDAKLVVDATAQCARVEGNEAATMTFEALRRWLAGGPKSA